MRMFAVLIKTSLLGGFLVLLPILLAYLLLNEAVELVIALATPIADLFPEGTFDFIGYPSLIALLLLVGVSLLLGLSMRFGLLRRLGRRFESSVLDRVPFYRAVRSLARSLLVADDNRAFKAAVFESAPDVLELVYVVENDGQRATVLRPHAPAGFVGPIAVVPCDRLSRLDVSVGDVSRALSHWGYGVLELLNERSG